jgi:hypothetical protein
VVEVDVSECVDAWVDSLFQRPGLTGLLNGNVAGYRRTSDASGLSAGGSCLGCLQSFRRSSPDSLCPTCCA